MAIARDPGPAAEALLKRHGVSEVPVDVEAIARAEGAIVLRESLDRNVSGLLLREEGSNLLAVNDTHHPRRQRFTIAHEVGHLLLHPGRPYTVDSTVRLNWRNDLSSLATDQEEIAANAFAAALLMPADAVRKAVGSLREGPASNTARVVELLAEQFDVSAEAMGYRLINLGISS